MLIVNDICRVLVSLYCGRMLQDHEDTDIFRFIL